MSRTDKLRWLAELPAGWHPLFTQFVEDLFAADCSIAIIEAKEKFATLRVYLDQGSDLARRLVAGVEAASARTCQQCGQQGELMVRDHIYATLSANHGAGWLKPAGHPLTSSRMRSRDENA